MSRPGKQLGRSRARLHRTRRRQPVLHVPMLRRFPITAALAAATLLTLWPLLALAQVDGEQHAPGGTCGASAHPPTPATADAPDWDTFFDCNGSTWQRGPYFFGSTSDTCNSSHAGMTQWTGSVMGYCNGSAWTKFEPVQSTPVETAPAGSGYFVLSGGTYTGNLSDTSGLDSTCLTDLTTNTGWQGYSTAHSNGQLISLKVFAFYV